MGKIREKFTRENILMGLLAIAVVIIIILLIYLLAPPSWIPYLLSTPIFEILAIAFLILGVILYYILKALISRLRRKKMPSL
jgi:hypothetical protein